MQPNPDPPLRIADRYELTQAISTGGMGQVWRGYDTVLDRDIAVKLIRPDLVGSEDRDELVGRFRREARVTARIEHPGVPAVYDAAFDEHADRLFMVMQLVHGVSLADLLAETGPLPVDWAVSVAAQVCAVLSYAHAVPVVHRDLKPGNIMVATDGTARVLDFGVAAVLRSDVTRLTATGRVVGTRPYMSPEQIRNTPVTPRADLYGLGCVLHELLAGQRPFDADDEIALMYQHLEQPPTPLRELRAEVPADVEALVLDLLAKDPDDRPADARTVYARLAPHLPVPEPVPAGAEGSVEVAPPPGGLPDPTRPYRRPMAPRPRPVVGVPTVVRGTAPVTGPRTVEPAEPTGSTGSTAVLVSAEEVDAALDRAEELIDQGRFSQAADGLARVIAAARVGRAADDPAVLDLRSSHAGALLLGGDLRRALPELDALAVAYTRAGGPDDDLALDCRGQAAYCRMQLGEIADALAEYQAVYAVHHRRGDDLAEEVLELRRTIARLQMGVGQERQAAAALPGLHRDAVAVLGPDDPLTAEIHDLLTRLHLPGDLLG